MTAMLRFRRSSAYRTALLVLSVVALCGRQAGAAGPEPIFLRFEVSAGPGLHVLTLGVTVDEAGEAYSIAAEAETRSLADLFLDLRSRLQVRGIIAAGALLPGAMRAETHRRGADFYTRIDYGANGSVTAEASPPPASPVTPVTAAQMRGTVDQLTAYLALARTLARRGSCALALAVFDGRRRYDLNFTDAPAEALPGFAGTNRVCLMARRRIAGFPADRGASEKPDQGKLWFARLMPGDLMIPIRMDFDSEFGTFTADLAELRGRGVYLRLAE
ncbi:MAG TPA: DUF3108 domain-containing protein [Stellaceae bacterium]|nr:DUF3108 domain-containing protein [Stellaceae bacterium]